MTSFLLGGCAVSAPTHVPGLVSSWDRQTPLPATAAPPIDVILRVRYTTYDDRPGSAWFQRRFSEPLMRHYLEKTKPRFPCLANAQRGRPDAAYRLVIDATHAFRSNRLQGFLATASLFLIPNHLEIALELEAKVYRGATLLKTYQASGSYRSTLHLMFLPISFRRFSVPDRSKEDTFSDLFLQIQRDAPTLFQSSGPLQT